MRNHKTKNSTENASIVHIRSWQPVVFFLIMALALYVIVPQLSQFSESYEIIRRVNMLALGAGFLCVAGAVMMGSAAYKSLVLKNIPYMRIASVQWAGMFVNRLLPAGLGGMSLMGDFLYRHKHSVGQASTVVLLNNFIGMIAHALLLSFAFIFLPSTFMQIDVPDAPVAVGAVIALSCIAVMILASSKLFHSRKLKRFFHEIKTALLFYRKRSKKVWAAVCYAALNTTFHALALAWVLQAFGYAFDLSTAIIVLTGGVAAATASPTPGGLVGAEAGLTAALVAFQIPVASAFAIALAYRLISYWLPMLPGVAAFLFVRRNRYV